MLFELQSYWVWYADSALALFLMSLARCAKRSVLSVSAKHALAGLMLAIMNVFELPPKESCMQHRKITEAHSHHTSHPAMWHQAGPSKADKLHLPEHGVLL